jgi:hypothetical protein
MFQLVGLVPGVPATAPVAPLLYKTLVLVGSTSNPLQAPVTGSKSIRGTLLAAVVKTPKLLKYVALLVLMNVILGSTVLLRAKSKDKLGLMLFLFEDLYTKLCVWFVVIVELDNEVFTVELPTEIGIFNSSLLEVACLKKLLDSKQSFESNRS